MTDRQMETVKGMKVSDFLRDDEIEMFVGIRQTEARCKPVPTVDQGVIDGLNEFLADVHADSNENSYRWAAKVKDDLDTYLISLQARYDNRAEV